MNTTDTTFDIFAPMPPAETLEAYWTRQPSGIKFPEVPRPGHASFVGPLPVFSMKSFYDPRPNVPGQTYWGD
jgi:hypothetical protein